MRIIIFIFYGVLNWLEWDVIDQDNSLCLRKLFSRHFPDICLIGKFVDYFILFTIKTKKIEWKLGFSTFQVFLYLHVWKGCAREDYCGSKKQQARVNKYCAGAQNTYQCKFCADKDECNLKGDYFIKHISWGDNLRRELNYQYQFLKSWIWFQCQKIRYNISCNLSKFNKIG